MSIEREEIRFRGKTQFVPSVRVDDRTIIASGGLVKVARVKDEELVQGELIADPDEFVRKLRRSELKADVFSFAERPPQLTPRYGYAFDWDNWAVLATSSYRDWWENRLPQESRKNVRRASKRGVMVRVVPFDDQLVTGIQHIYNETAVRQDRSFWHFGKDFAAVKTMNETYVERGAFIGAYFEERLIGFIKLVYVDHVATIVQILAMNAHHDKRPMNAMLAHAVEHCERRGTAFLVYGKYDYGNTTATTSLGEFKRRMGFEKVSFPRYYLPLTLTGKMAVKCGLHTGMRSLISPSAAGLLLKCRAQYYRLRAKVTSAAASK